MKVVSLSMTDTEVQALDELVHTMRRFKSRSHALRAALRLLLLDQKIKPAAISKITAEHSRPRDRRRPAG